MQLSKQDILQLVDDLYEAEKDRRSVKGKVKLGHYDYSFLDGIEMVSIYLEDVL